MVEKSRLEDWACDSLNGESFFHDLSRALRKDGKNPLNLDAATIARAFHRVSKKIDTLTEKLEDEGLLKGG